MPDCQLHLGDCVEVLSTLPERSVDLTVTSPPYGDMREYKGFSFNFEKTAQQLYRVTKDGGVVVWVVGDKTVGGSETGVSFRHALGFMEAGFNLHDTMIYKRHSPFPPNTRYWQSFEYMFVFSKEKPAKFTPILQDKTSFYRGFFSARRKDGSVLRESGNTSKRLNKAESNKQRIKDNIWDIGAGYMKSTPDKIAYKHPAIFPEALAHDHILSWSKEGDIVLDCFMGSGTTGKMALLLNRNFIGIEIAEEYMEIAKQRIEEALKKETT